MVRARHFARFALYLVFSSLLLLLAHGYAAAQDALTVTGTLSYIWADAVQDGALVGLPPMLTLLDEQGEQHPISLDSQLAAAYGGVDALLGRTVTLRIDPAADAESTPVAAPVMAIENVLSLDSTETNLALGNERWLMLLCRPPEYTQTVPNPQQHYDALLGDTAPGMNHYWRELSYDQYSTAASRAAGWFTLPKPWRSYIKTFAGETSYGLDATPVKADCTAAADATVYFPDYDGILFVVPVAPLGMKEGLASWYAWAWYGKTDRLQLDGVDRGYRTVYFPIEIAAWASSLPSVWPHNILPHEMGHTLGLPHSSGAYGETYDSGWDVMSGSRWQGKSYKCTRDDEYGCLAPHTIAYHKALLGWIAPAQTVVAEAGSSRMLVLARPVGPPAESTLYLKIPLLGSTTHFYTAEARGGLYYEGSVPATAVVLHEVDTTRGDCKAQVVDPDLNGDPNDAVSAWVPGETFNDPINEVNFCVEAATASGFLVGVGNGAPAPCTFAPSFATATLGLNPTFASPGETMKHSLEMSNGGSLAHNVVVTVTLPAALAVVTSTIEVEGGSLESMDPLVFKIGDMDFNAAAHLHFDVLVDPTLTSTITPTAVGEIAWDGGRAVLNGEAPVVDSTPPTTTISILGDVNVYGEYAGPATVVITASDAGTGVRTTQYSLDDGETWRVYTTLLSIAPGAAQAIQAFSIDNAGNEEQPPQRATLRFDTLAEYIFLPAVIQAP